MNKSKRVVTPRKIALAVMRVRSKPGAHARGWLLAGPLAIPVAIGRSGIKANKFEGDGGTPRGRFRLVRLWWRADRLPRPSTLLPTRRIRLGDGWCEDPNDRHYNKPIHMPQKKEGDRLTRSDRLYDFIIELDHNTRPRIARRGSAVFIHVARDNFGPTAGCVALAHGTLRKLLAHLGPHTRIDIR
jgi:L,D-peptidoglycan transpeptidase YkuD (ErfK/YbiS/YcfS/YnhG family)